MQNYFGPFYFGELKPHNSKCCSNFVLFFGPQLIFAPFNLAVLFGSRNSRNKGHANTNGFTVFFIRKLSDATRYINWKDTVEKHVTIRDVFRATVLAKLTYCWPASSGYCTAADLGRLDGFLRRCRRLGYCEQSQPSIAELFSDIDDTFLVVVSLILNIFYNSFYTIVQPPTLSDQEIIAKL